MKTFTFFIAVSILCSCSLTAQWTNIGLEGRSIKDIACGNNAIFAVTADSGSVYRSTDGGNSWLLFIPSGISEAAIAPSGSVFIITDTISSHIVYRSTNNGNSWDSTYYNLRGLFTIFVDPTGIVFCGEERGAAKSSGTGIIYSHDDGVSWDSVSSDVLGGREFAFGNGSIITYGSCSGVGAGGDAIVLSSDGGSSWQDLGGSPGGFKSLSLSTSRNIFCGTSEGVYRSHDLCTTWTKISYIIAEDLFALPYVGILAGTDSGGIFLFSDNGDSLGTLNEGLTNLNVHTLAMDSLGYVYAGTDDGVFKRKIHPTTQLIGLAGRSIKDIACRKNAIFAVTADSGSVYSSTDGGNNWESIFESGAEEVAVSSSNTVFLVTDSLLVSTDNGYSWKTILGTHWGSELSTVAVSPSGTIYCGYDYTDWISSSTHFQVSTDNGISWSYGANGGSEFSFSTYGIVSAGFAGGGGGAAGFDGIVISIDSGVTWSYADPTESIFVTSASALHIDALGNIIYGYRAYHDHNGDYQGAIKRSTDLGLTWTNIMSVEPEDIIGLPDGNLLMATIGQGIVILSGDGDSLGTLNQVLTNLNVHTLAMDSLGYVYAGTDSGVFRVIIPDTILAPSSVHHLQAGWNLLSLPIHPSIHDKDINYPGALSDAFEYNGVYEACQELCACKGYWLKVVGESYYDLWGEKIYHDSVVVSAGWNMIGSLSESFSASTITSVPAGIATSSFWEYDGTQYVTSEMINPGKGYWVKVNQDGQLTLSTTSKSTALNRIKIVASNEQPPPPPNSEIPNTKSQIPTRFALEQNYPNPFNPVTNFQFSIANCQLTTLKVYDVLGREVVTLVNEVKQPGEYTITWDADNVPSGIYFYRLTAGRPSSSFGSAQDGGSGRAYVETKKLILMK